MIRIYLDWNVISNLKKPEFREIKDFITEHKIHLQFPYSPAHFADLMKSYLPENAYFSADLEMLEFLSEEHLIRWGKDGIEPLYGTPKEYFATVKDKQDIFELMNMEKVFQDLDGSMEELGLGKMGKLMKALYQLQPSGIEITKENEALLKKMFPNLQANSSMWDLMKDIGPFSKKLTQDRDYYKAFRKSIAESGFRLEANSGNWSYDEVIKNIDKFLMRLGAKMTYLEYVESIFKHKKEPINKYEFYTSAYLMLDMIGYKTDNLPKSSDNMQNIQTDAEHSFYGAYCDYFVAIDKKLRIKFKVLYNEFHISTKVIEPSELISELKKVVDPISKEYDFIEEALSFCNNEYLVEAYPKSEDKNEETYVFRLPKFYFNFFNYVFYTYYPEQEGLVLTFRKVFKNFSKFIYYFEEERLIKLITDFFGYDNIEDLELRKKEFVYESKDITFNWSFDNGLILLEKEEDTNRPILNYIISTKRKKSEEL